MRITFTWKKTRTEFPIDLWTFFFLEQSLQSPIKKIVECFRKVFASWNAVEQRRRRFADTTNCLWRPILYIKYCNYILLYIYTIKIYFVKSIEVYTWSVGVTPAGTRIRRRWNFLSRRMCPGVLSSSIQPVAYTYMCACVSTVYILRDRPLSSFISYKNCVCVFVKIRIPRPTV